MKFRMLLLALLVCVPLSVYADENDTVKIQSFKAPSDATAIAGVKKVKNVILMIGDGMGFNAVSAARMAAFGRGIGLVMDGMEVTGQSLTNSADDDFITDSAAGATALASGVKTLNGRIGEDVECKKLRTITDVARDLGKSTGVVALCTVTDATPACFSSHAKARANHWEIAKGIADEPLDVLIGGGRQYFLPGSNPESARDDELDLLGVIRKRGTTVATSVDEFRALDLAKVKSLAALLEPDASEPAGKRPYELAELTKAALDILSRNPKGFFLMVEASQIDWAGHGNNLQYSVGETLDFDKAIKVALDFAKDGETLVIVTADHETGGLGLNKGSESKSEMTAGWTTGSHTNAAVPIFASGPNAEAFGRVIQNINIPQLAVQGWGVKNFAGFAYGK
jgi:alkaline phosphatase